MLDGKRRFAADPRIKPIPIFSIGLLEDANSVQVAVMQVLQILGSGQMDAKTAGLMLYGLQTASANLKNVKFEAEKVTDVVIDCNSVGQTCINGPQWFAGDFAEQDQPEPVEEDEMEEMAKAESEEVLGEVGQGAVAREQVIEKVVSTAPMVREEIRPERVVVKRKKAGPRRLEDEPPSLAKTLLLRLGLPLTPPQEGEADSEPAAEAAGYFLLDRSAEALRHPNANGRFPSTRLEEVPRPPAARSE